MNLSTEIPLENSPVDAGRVNAHSRASRMLGPALSLKELNFICWGLFLAALTLPLGFVMSTQKQTPDADFVYFYAMGRLLNEYPAERVYDYALQQKVCTEIHPLQTGKYGPIPYPPFVGTFFRPFARIPYRAAYAVWLCISLLLYLAGLAIISRRYFRDDPLRRSLIFCFALSFYPFTIDTFINGQLSAIGFFALALAIREDDRDRLLRSGLALSVCLYKPTLLVLLLPMLLVTKRFKTLLGFGAGAAALALFTTAAEGTRIWAGYATLLLNFGQAATGVHMQSFLRLRKYVDLTSLSSMAPGGRSWLGLAIVYGFSSWAALFLFWLWWKSARTGRPARGLVWATTITWTLLLNAYVPRHDSILCVLALVITAGVLKDSPARTLYGWFTVLWLLILASSWITDEFAAAHGIQIITPMFAALGTLQFSAWRDLAEVS
jgi:hypothetical protein